MAVSQRQLDANRQNAQKSTGPRTPEGKAVSSRNAITHGIHATGIVINSPFYEESTEDYESLVASLVDELKPHGVFQEHQVIKIANCMWRYRRAIKAETAAIHHRLDWYAHCHDLTPDDFMPDDDENAPQYPHEDDNALRARGIPTTDDSKNIQIYQMRLDRELQRAYAMLHHLKRLEAASSPKDVPESSSITRVPGVATADADCGLADLGRPREYGHTQETTHTSGFNAVSNHEQLASAFRKNEPISTQPPARVGHIPGGRL